MALTVIDIADEEAGRSIPPGSLPDTGRSRGIRPGFRRPYRVACAPHVAAHAARFCEITSSAPFLSSSTARYSCGPACTGTRTDAPAFTTRAIAA